jgi:hypothetical protein
MSKRRIILPGEKAPEPEGADGQQSEDQEVDFEKVIRETIGTQHLRQLLEEILQRDQERREQEILQPRNPADYPPAYPLPTIDWTYPPQTTTGDRLTTYTTDTTSATSLSTYDGGYMFATYHPPIQTATIPYELEVSEDARNDFTTQPSLAQYDTSYIFGTLFQAGEVNQNGRSFSSESINNITAQSIVSTSKFDGDISVGDALGVTDDGTVVPINDSDTPNARRIGFALNAPRAEDQLCYTLVEVPAESASSG